jgi:hypothetical protein
MGGGGGGDVDGIEELFIEDGIGAGGKLEVDVVLLGSMFGSVLPVLAGGISLSMPGRGVDGVGGMVNERGSPDGGTLAPGAPFSLRSVPREVLGKPLTLELPVLVEAAGAGGVPPALLTSLPVANPDPPPAAMMPGEGSAGFFGGGSMLAACPPLAPTMPGVAGADGPGRAVALESVAVFPKALGL